MIAEAYDKPKPRLRVSANPTVTHAPIGAAMAQAIKASLLIPEISDSHLVGLVEKPFTGTYGITGGTLTDRAGTVRAVAEFYDPQREGNDHYAKLAIDPFKYAMENRLDALQFTVIKYVTRFRDKGGIRDLKEARATIDRLIEHETRKGTK